MEHAPPPPPSTPGSEQFGQCPLEGRSVRYTFFFFADVYNSDVVITQAMDTDGNGQIDMVEFWDGIKRFDLGITPIQWADLLRAFDDDISNGIGA